MNTGRFVGSSGRLEDTITRNNIEAAREVMRQLRLRDIGGIIVIDFIDMASAKNRAEVLNVLQAELENDRTKTYLVEISPLGLVEMTRQNVTAGVREILTRTCPTCGGEGVVLSEQTMAVEAERRLRRIARSSGAEAFLVRLNAKVASGLVGAGGMKLLELERETGKHFTLEPVERMLLSEVDVVREGTRAEIDGDAVPFADGDERTVKISEPHMYNVTDGVARVDGGYPVVVGGAIGYVGQQHKVRIDRATRTAAYATLLDAKPTAIDLPPEPGDYELPEFDREVGERLELEQRTRPRTRRKTGGQARRGREGHGGHDRGGVGGGARRGAGRAQAAAALTRQAGRRQGGGRDDRRRRRLPRPTRPPRRGPTVRWPTSSMPPRAATRRRRTAAGGAASAEAAAGRRRRPPPTAMRRQRRSRTPTPAPLRRRRSPARRRRTMPLRRRLRAPGGGRRPGGPPVRPRPRRTASLRQLPRPRRRLSRRPRWCRRPRRRWSLRRLRPATAPRRRPSASAACWGRSWADEWVIRPCPPLVPFRGSCTR